MVYEAILRVPPEVGTTFVAQPSEKFCLKLRLDVHFFCACLPFSAAFFSTHRLDKKASIRKKGTGGCVMSVEVASQNIKAAEKDHQKYVL